MTLHKGRMAPFFLVYLKGQHKHNVLGLRFEKFITMTSKVEDQSEKINKKKMKIRYVKVYRREVSGRICGNFGREQQKL